MNEPSKKPWKKSWRVIAILAGVGLVLLILLVLLGWLYLPKGLYTYPRPPLPKAFPPCPEIPTKPYSWRGVRLLKPADWRTLILDRESTGPGMSMVSIEPPDAEDMRAMVDSVSIGEYSALRSRERRKVIEDAWSLKPGESLDPIKYEMLGDEAVPESIRRLTISGHRGLLYLTRGLGIYGREHDSWNLLILHGDKTYEVGGQAMFNPYVIGPKWEIIHNEELAARHEELACGYWTIVRSLQLPK
ncbi:MAG: hypothetical protein HY924_01575 [Elusimicrobia bacterium]|nr:hypothetical protein [Elusimicrobiota bacterium]